MAKKPKTPRPPVQAPKRRETKSAPMSGVSRWWLVLAAIVAAGAIVGIVFAMSGGSSSSNVQAAMEAAGCTLREAPVRAPKDGSNFHNDSPTLTTKVGWSTDPPSGGGHYSLWSVWNFFRSPINPRKVVHNLEHGGVAIWWGPQVPRATVDQLETFYRDSPQAIIGTPYPGLGNKIALTAWTGDPATYYRDGDYGIGHIALCPSFDEDAFKSFVSAYREKGPERGTDNSPGSGPQ